MIALNQRQLKALVHYEPKTGNFIWLKRDIRPNYRRFDLAWNTRYASKIAGCVRHAGRELSYIKIRINKKNYQAHRLVFLYMTGEFPSCGIDHKDADGLNNRWNNLRKANQSQNLANRRINYNNTSGFKGVHFNKRDKCYQAYIGIKGKLKHLGSYNTADAAHASYMIAAKKYFGNFSRSR